MSKLAIVAIELGMIGGMVVGLYLVPESTPLPTFLIASGVCFVTGNVLLFRKVRQNKSDVPAGKPWTHFFRAFAILAVGWLLILLLYRR
jgi:hypothetical protein